MTSNKLILFAPLFLLAALGTGAHCGGPPAPSPDDPEDTSWCPKAEARLTELQCWEALGFPDGKVYDPAAGTHISFAAFCENAQNAGTLVFPACLAQVDSCQAIQTECWR